MVYAHEQCADISWRHGWGHGQLGGRATWLLCKAATLQVSAVYNRRLESPRQIQPVAASALAPSGHGHRRPTDEWAAVAASTTSPKHQSTPGGKQFLAFMIGAI